MKADVIRVRGARVHNLRNVDLDIPRNRLIAVCGVSGSGKTSLAMDTLYAEGQRRYIESFSAYTRQFLQRLDKPDFDEIQGLPPAMAVRRMQAHRSNRSTVGTVSESIDYLRLFFAKCARLSCYQCKAEITQQSPQTVSKLIGGLPKSAKLMVAFETGWLDIAERAERLAELQSSGLLRLICGDQEVQLGSTERDQLASSLPTAGRVWVVIDRLHGGDTSPRVSESLELAFDRGFGQASLFINSAESDSSAIDLNATTGKPRTIGSQDWQQLDLSSRLICTNCCIEYPAAEPRLFSFNSPLGACPVCEGFGDAMMLDMDAIVPDPSLSIRQGAIAPWNGPAYRPYLDELLEMADAIGIPVDMPFSRLAKKWIKILLEGHQKTGFVGINGFFQYLERKKYKLHVRVFLSRWRRYEACSSCGGTRLNEVAKSYNLQGHDFTELCSWEISHLADFLRSLTFEENEQSVAAGPLSSVADRLNYLNGVGLGYLSLDRTIRTLSGGEAQRTLLTSALGSSLVNMLYVLDEPSVGLHPHDVAGLAKAIQLLSARGNTLLMIEHEEALISKADWLVEVGPGAGTDGGTVVCSGPLDQIPAKQSLTVDYLAGARTIPIPGKRRDTDGPWIVLSGCCGNNLQQVDFRFPLGVFCVVTGVSGSGKSSLVQDTLSGALLWKLNKTKVPTLPFRSLEGSEFVDECVVVDQHPVSRSSRSNPVTYIKAYDEIRQVFAATIESKTRNLGPGHFSFNSPLGQCDNCKGDGTLQIDMQFLADVYINCPVCHGRRFRPEILAVRYRDRSIADVLNMTVREAQLFFRGAAKVQKKLQVLIDVGLEYLRLGQSANTLSAGEAQRLKLASHLAAASQKHCLFIFDEPTTGLHTHDLHRMLGCFSALVDAGHSLLVVEHNLHVIAAADHIVDIGPGPADQGGRIVATGTPEEVALCGESLTGKYLREHLAKTRKPKQAT
ncbi:MAG: excinuclease ABC subunit UvrA [Planctomycetales bacterium]|nr:excinuclease ABC subunit UvrA [Planctomycetales bacterium]